MGAHQEGRNHWKVWHQVRRLPEEDCEEDGDLAALQVRLHLLWQGQDEEAGHWHLVLQRQELQDPGGWRCLHLHHHCRSLHQVCREEAEGDEGGLNAALVILITSPQLGQNLSELWRRFCAPIFSVSQCATKNNTCGRFRKKKKKKKKTLGPFKKKKKKKKKKS